MALSGTVNSSSYKGRYLQLTWSATQNVANNTSTISWTLKGAGNSTESGVSWYMAGNFKVVIDGSTVYSKSQDYRIQLSNGTTVASGTKTITHNTDGTRSFSISIQGGIYYYAVNCTGSGSFSLNQIPRGATITAAPNFNDEQNPTISYSNPAGNVVTALDACISFDGSADNVGYRAVSKTGNSYTFTLTEAERNVLRNGTTGSNSRTVKFYLRTQIAGQTFYNSIDRTLTIVNGSAVLSPTVSDSNSTTTALTGNNQTFIRYYSNAAVAAGATARKGASLKSYKITNGAKSITSASGTLNGVETGSFTFSVTDSRGNTTTQTVNKTLINYIKLTCNIKARVLVDGTATIAINGNVFNGSFGAVQNTLALQYRYKLTGGSYSSWLGVNGTKSGNTYSATANIEGLDYTKQYTFQVRAYDKLMTVNSPEQTAIAMPVFDWGAESFNFNVPVTFSAGFSQAASLVDDAQPVADFIVEQGTLNGWTYRKWNSGVAECWRRIAVNTAVSTAWGGLFVSGYLSATNLSLPFTFKEIPMINVNLSGSGSGAFLIASGSSSASTTTTGGYEIARGTSGAANNYAINYDVRGRWK